MKKLLYLLIVGIACLYSCEEIPVPQEKGKNLDRDSLPDTYVLGHFYNLEDTFVIDEYPYQMAIGASGACGEGYEDRPVQWMGLGFGFQLYDTTYAPYTKSKFGFSIEIPFECDSFATQESFYNLLDTGTYPVSDFYDWKILQPSEIGKFHADYTFAEDGWMVRWGTGYGNQNGSYVRIVECERIPPACPEAHQTSSCFCGGYWVRLIIRCKIYDKWGDLMFEINNLEYADYMRRQTPWGINNWTDQYDPCVKYDCNTSSPRDHAF